MARKSVFTTERASKIVECISLGYTLKDVAYLSGVSTETIRRWRDRYPDFSKRIVEASNYQWDHPEVLITYHNPNYHKYKRRKVVLNPDYGAKTAKDTTEAVKQPLEALKPAKRRFMCGLPVRCSTVSDLSQPIAKYYNASNGRVEWVDKYPPTGRLILHSCTLDVYRRKVLERQTRQEMPPIVVF